MTFDNLNTHKIKLHKNRCWWHSRNQTISLVPSEQNFYKFAFNNSNSQDNCLKQIFCFILIIALSLFRFELSRVKTKYKTISGIFVQLTTTFFPTWSNFAIKLQVQLAIVGNFSTFTSSLDNWKLTEINPS